jgi:hypothetical protein
MKIQEFIDLNEAYLKHVQEAFGTVSLEEWKQSIRTDFKKFDGDAHLANRIHSSILFGARMNGYVSIDMEPVGYIETPIPAPAPATLINRVTRFFSSGSSVQDNGLNNNNRPAKPN